MDKYSEVIHAANIKWLGQSQWTRRQRAMTNGPQAHLTPKQDEQLKV